MIIVGLTGLIASGKSTLSNILLKNNIPVFDADAMIAELYKDDVVIEYLNNLLVEEEVVAINKSILSNLAFNNPFLLKELEKFLHPKVREKMHEFIKRHKSLDAELIILDIALLFEGGLNKICDKVIVSHASDEVITKRYMERPNSSVKKLENILAKQKQYDKVGLADYVIDTDKGLADTEIELLKVINEIKNA